MFFKQDNASVNICTVLKINRKSESRSSFERTHYTMTFRTKGEANFLIDGKLNESIWQKKIRNILQLLYPKYILCTPEVTFKGVDGYDKRPDFLLVDVNGFIDILEIKRPDVQVLTKQASYRNNYVPVREFAGAIQQIEKYIYCLNSINDKEATVLKVLSEKLPESVIPQVVNPQGILLLGRSKDFNQQQKRDFELIKRQYKNIADIMTYDELVSRLRNIVISLRKRL